MTLPMVHAPTGAFDPDALAAAAFSDIERNQLAAAEHKCLRVLAVYEQHGGALTALGMLLHAQGRHEDAVRAFNALTVYEPQNQQAWMNLGSALRRLQRYDEALAIYDRAMKVAQPSPDLMYNIGSMHMERGDYESSYAFLSEAMRAAPRSATARRSVRSGPGTSPVARRRIRRVDCVGRSHGTSLLTPAVHVYSRVGDVPAGSAVRGCRPSGQ